MCVPCRIKPWKKTSVQEWNEHVSKQLSQNNLNSTEVYMTTSSELALFCLWKKLNLKQNESKNMQKRMESISEMKFYENLVV
jgi:hypothetical protein